MRQAAKRRDLRKEVAHQEGTGEAGRGAMWALATPQWFDLADIVSHTFTLVKPLIPPKSGFRGWESLREGVGWGTLWGLLRRCSPLRLQMLRA